MKVSNKTNNIWYQKCLFKAIIFWGNLIRRKETIMFPFCVQTYVRFWYILSLTLLSGSLYSHRWSDNEKTIVQYRILIPAPVDRTSSSAWLYKHRWITPSTLMTHIVCESKLHSVLRSSMHPCPVNHVAIGCVVVYHARDAHASSTGIKCWHCWL